MYVYVCVFVICLSEEFGVQSWYQIVLSGGWSNKIMEMTLKIEFNSCII